MQTRTVIFTLALTLPGLFACSDNNDTSAEDDTPVSLATDEKNVSEPTKKDDDGGGEGPLSKESGMIEYALEGMQSGTITKYWRKHGMEMAEYHDTRMDIMGMVQTEKKWLIVRPDGIFNVNQANNTATRAENPGTAMAENMNRDQMQAFGKEMLQNMGTRNGTKEVAGETCELWTMTGMGTEVCMWEGVDLYTSTDMAGMGMTRTAVKIVTGKVDDKHFEVPDGVQIKEMGNPLDWQEQMKRAQEFMPK